jgi:tetratricopeptide (TPR) repeat protein
MIMPYSKQIYRSLALTILGLTLMSGHSLAANGPGLFTESFSFEAKGNVSRALNSMLKLLREDPRSYLANLRAGWLFYRLGKYSEAIHRYSRALRIRPKSIEADLGIMLPFMAGRWWGKADEVGRKILQRDPLNYTVLSRLAFIKFSTGSYGESIRLYQRVLELYPSDSEMQRGLAWAYLRMGKKSQARHWFQEVLKVYPSHVAARAGMDALDG